MTEINKANIESSQRTLKKLNKKLKNEIQGRQDEIKKINEHFSIQLDGKRRTNSENIANLKEQHSIELTKAIDHKNLKLNELKENLEDNRKILDKEKSTLQGVHRENITDIKTIQEDQLQNTMMRAFDSQRELTDKVFNETAKLNLESDDVIATHTLEMDDKIDRHASTQDLKLRKQHRNFEIKNATQDEDFRLLQTQKELDHRNEMGELLEKQHVEQIAREGIYRSQMNTMKKHHSQSMKQTDESYKSAMNKLIQNHQNAMDTMKGNFKKHMQHLQNDLSTQKEVYVNKTQDEFYQIEKLNPSYNRDNDYYYFEVEIPEHEKEQVKIQAYDRDVKISLSRIFENSVEDSRGKNHKSARTEVLTQEFQIPDLLDGNQISQNYEDNKLTFRVKIK